MLKYLVTDMNALEQMDQQDGWQVEQEARIILSKLGFPDVNQKWLCYLVVKSGALH